MFSTIRDVANRAGVSPSTVSRVLNDSCSISEITKEKIYKAVEELDYHPSSLAKSFATGRVNAIVLVLDASASETFSNAFFNRSVFAVEMVLQQHGYILIISNDRQINNGRNFVEEMIFSRRADGLLIPSTAANDKFLERLDKLNIPYVVLGQPEIQNSSSWVDVDNALGAQQAVEYLLNQNYHRIAFLTDNHNALFTQKRLYGYIQALKAADIAYDKLLAPVCANESECKSAIESLLESAPHPNAFLCGNNTLAFHTLQAVKRHNFSVPKDIGIVTFDNFPLAEYTEPPLTSVDIDTYQLGEKAAELLLKKIKNKKKLVQTILLPTTLVERESTQRKGSSL